VKRTDSDSAHVTYGDVQNVASPAEIPQAVNIPKRAIAKRHSLSERTIDNLVAAGMPVLRISTRKLLFPVADCDIWLRERFLVSRRRVIAGGVR